MKAVSLIAASPARDARAGQADVHPLRGGAAEIAPAPSLEVVARDRLSRLAIGLAALHIILAFGHLLVPVGWDLRSPLSMLQEVPWSRLPAWVLAIASAFFFFVMRLLLPRLPLRWAHPLGTFTSTIVVLNALGWFMLGIVPEKTVPVAFAIFGAGALIFTTRALVMVVGIAIGGWLWFAWQAGFSPIWYYFGGVLGASALLSILFQRLHLQAFKQMLRTSPESFAGHTSSAETDEHFRRWYEATFEGIAIHEKGVLVEANQALAALLRRPVESLPGLNLLDWFTRASRNVIEESILLGNFRPFEAVALRSDKTEVPVELFTKRITYAGREVMVTAFRDITERQRAAEALNAEQRRLKLQYQRQVALSKLAAIIGEATEVTRILDCIVETASKILPARGGAFLIVPEREHLALAASFHPEPRPGFDALQQFARVAEWVRENRETFVASNVTTDDPFEVNRPVEFISSYVASPLFDGDRLLGILFVLDSGAARHFTPDEMDFLGELAGRAAMAIAKAHLYEELSEANRDLEKQKAMLEIRNQQFAQAKVQAEIASDAKSEFLAKISHELRTPLNGVIGMTDYLLTTPLSGDQRESAEAVHASAERLLGQINRILDFSRLDTGLFTPTLVDFNAGELVHALVEKAESSRGRKPLAIRAIVQDGLPAGLRGDAPALKRALWNLLDNAVRFTERGEVAIEVACQAGAGAMLDLQFTLRDTGPGIPRSVRERLFDPFAQADNSLSRGHEGLGLGLATTRRLVERMHGRIFVESTPGEGSVFSLSVPVKAVEVPLAASAA